jgi:hydroxymethylpyrimidine pyrophosphatase-like HAD family hydrolase
MKPRVLALDFDGTIADNDRIDADVVAPSRKPDTPACWSCS